MSMDFCRYSRDIATLIFACPSTGNVHLVNTNSMDVCKRNYSPEFSVFGRGIPLKDAPVSVYCLLSISMIFILFGSPQMDYIAFC